ncbi:hypothetical protein GIB67_018047 [Kingdonia uniflora]|uniref:Uncharacterized protein n=1 Tax=Kingdonia uniflora TaxID=39325 RepID=A0A7J7NWQ1_9MAGN|nr:hypothetical protein GIB67_018047 [Kingdonia uniflora]
MWHRLLIYQLRGGDLFGLPVGFIADSLGATIGAAVAFLFSRTSYKIDMRKQVFCNRSLNMKNIIAVTFDMDYTLAQYMPESFKSLAIDSTIRKLLLKWTFDWEYMVRGLVLDKKTSLILKLLKWTFDWEYMVRGLVLDKKTGLFLKVSYLASLDYRCICKTWCAIIDDYRFAKMQLSLSIKNNSVSCTSFILFAFDHGYLEQAYLVEDKGRLGLVVCGIAKNSITVERQYIIVEGNIFHGLFLKHCNCLRKVHNPDIRKSAELPPPDGVGAGLVVFKLDFDVIGKEFMVLRYRSNPREYMNVKPEEDSVNEESESEEESENEFEEKSDNEDSEEDVQIEESEEDVQIEGSKIKEFEAEVLTLGTNTWRRVGVPPYELSMSPFYFNGAIHWITKFKNNLLLIASFDMASE